MFNQLLIRDDSSLFDSIHAFLYEHIDPPLVVNQCLEVTSVDDLQWDNFKRNPHKLRVW